jgi:hypothetical protein
MSNGAGVSISLLHVGAEAFLAQEITILVQRNHLQASPACAMEQIEREWLLQPCEECAYLRTDCAQTS